MLIAGLVVAAVGLLALSSRSRNQSAAPPAPVVRAQITKSGTSGSIRPSTVTARPRTIVSTHTGTSKGPTSVPVRVPVPILKNRVPSSVVVRRTNVALR